MKLFAKTLVVLLFSLSAFADGLVRAPELTCESKGLKENREGYSVDVKFTGNSVVEREATVFYICLFCAVNPEPRKFTVEHEYDFDAKYEGQTGAGVWYNDDLVIKAYYPAPAISDAGKRIKIEHAEMRFEGSNNPVEMTCELQL